MKKGIFPLFGLILLLITSCTPAPPPTATASVPREVVISTPIRVPPTPTPVPMREPLMVFVGADVEESGEFRSLVTKVTWRWWEHRITKVCLRERVGFEPREVNNAECEEVRKRNSLP